MNRTGYPSTHSFKLPRTTILTLCGFVLVFLQALRENWTLDLKIRWKIQSISKMTLRKQSEKFNKRNIPTGNHVSRTLSVLKLVGARVHYHRDHVGVMSNTYRPSLTRTKHVAIIHISNRLVSRFTQSEAMSTVLHRMSYAHHAVSLTSRLPINSIGCLRNSPSRSRLSKILLLDLNRLSPSRSHTNSK